MKNFTHNGKPYSFKNVAANYARLKPRITRELADVAVNFFKDSFKRQGWRDKDLQKWKPRAANAPRNNGRAILVNRGHLRNSIITAEASTSKAVIKAPVPYAIAHNEGFTGTVQVKEHYRAVNKKVSVKSSSLKTGKTTSRTMMLNTGKRKVSAHTRKMNLPQRQFMGDSEVMFKKMDAVLIKAIDQIFNN